MYRFVFKVKATGEVLEATSHALNPAIRSTGKKVEDVEPVECWCGQKRIWHYDDSGFCKPD